MYGLSAGGRKFEDGNLRLLHQIDRGLCFASCVGKFGVDRMMEVRSGATPRMISVRMVKKLLDPATLSPRACGGKRRIGLNRPSRGSAAISRARRRDARRLVFCSLRKSLRESVSTCGADQSVTLRDQAPQPFESVSRARLDQLRRDGDAPFGVGGREQGR